jgi:hypothetical protein
MEWNGNFWREQDLARLIASDLEAQPFRVLAYYGLQGFDSLRESDTPFAVQGALSNGCEMLIQQRFTN